MESVTGFTVTGPPASTRCAKRDAASFAGTGRIPQVARPGPAIMPLVILLARLAATVAIDVGAFAYLAMSRLDFGVAIVFFIAHCFWAFGLMSPVVALAGNAPACIGAHLVAAWVDALARRVWLA